MVASITFSLLKIPMQGEGAEIDVEIDHPREVSSGHWSLDLKISGGHSQDFVCAGISPVHALAQAFRQLYAEFNSEPFQGVTLDGPDAPFDVAKLKSMADISDQLVVPTDLLDRLHPSPDALFDFLRPMIDEGMLREISEADYGQDAAKHYEALRLICDHGTILDPEKWHPTEVLELIRWSEPDDPAHKPGRAGRRGHLMRAFACVVLLRSRAEPDYASYCFGEEDTLSQLIESAMALGTPAEHALVSFLAWHAQRCIGFIRPINALTLLMRAMEPGNGDCRDDDLYRVAVWTAQEESIAHFLQCAVGDSELGPPWSWISRSGLQSAAWRARAEKLMARVHPTNSQDVNRVVERILSDILAAPWSDPWAN